MSRVVGAYICPRGVFGVVCQRRSAGLEVVQSFDVHGRLDSAADAARYLVRALETHGIARAELAVAVRGFGAAHHVLTFPPATDSVLDVIVAREVRRIEPQMANPAVAWTRLADDDAQPSDPQNQVDVLAAAMPGAAVSEFASVVSNAGHTLGHLTDLSVTMHRLADEFVPKSSPAALIAQLPDGAYIGFAVDGAIRFAVEPPVRPDETLPDAVAVSEEAELGMVFVRQQFRGAQVGQASVIASNEAYPELESVLGARLDVAITRLPLAGLSPGGVAAFGAVLDARSRHPVSVGGRAMDRRAMRSGSPLQLLAYGALATAVIVGIWAFGEALMARNTGLALADVQRRVQQESAKLAPALETAARRKLVRDITAASDDARAGRTALVRSLASIAGAVSPSVALDSISMDHTASGWRATLGGTVRGRTSAAAVQTLSAFHNSLARLAPVESLSLKQLSYADTVGQSVVRFEIAFRVVTKGRN
ncbi:MAG TPA: hypothetical protein VF483_08775 [Gemmatimonadaceae bacterium]